MAIAAASLYCGASFAQPAQQTSRAQDSPSPSEALPGPAKAKTSQAWQARTSHDARQPQLLAQASTNPPAPNSTASTAAQSGQIGQLQQVVVTAQFRSENLQQTPIAITALTSVDLEQMNLTNVNDLGTVVPNAYFRKPVSNYGPTETIGLRGVNQVDFSYDFEPAVAVYVDDIYHGTETGASLGLADLARVEVLNGPQGTLFGKDSLGGAIRLITNQPKGDDTGTLSVTYGQHHLVDVKGIGDFSLVANTLYARIVVLSSVQDGFGNDLDFSCEMEARGTPEDAGSLPASVLPTQGNGCSRLGLGGHNHQGVTLKLRYLVNDKLEINVDPDYTRQADEPYPQALLTPYGNATTDSLNYNYSTNVVYPKFGINYTASAPGQISPGSTTTTGNVNFVSPNPFDNYATYGDAVTGQAYDPLQYLTEWGLPITATYHITDNLTSKLILGYETYQSNWMGDADNTPFGITQDYQDQEYRQYTAEFRLTGTSFAGRLDWTAGIFYYNSRARSYYPTNFDAFAYPLLPYYPEGELPNFVANDYYTDKERAAYLHANIKLTDKWSVTAGVRYTDELKSNIFDHVSTVPADSEIYPYPLGLTAVRFDWSGSLNFQATKNILFYGSVATGFRSPGFSPRIFTIGQLTEVPGEHATQYEIGNKADFFDHRLRANTAIFYIDYAAHLNLAFAAQCNLPSDLNAGIPYTFGQFCPAGTPLAGTSGIPWFNYTVAPANIRGVEEQLSAEPIDRLMLSLTFGFNQFRSQTSDPLAVGYINPTVKQQPEINMSGGIQYGVNLGSVGTLTPRIDWSYQSFMTDGPTNTVQIHPDYIIPGYSLFNVRLTFTPSVGNWYISAGISNALNKFYWEQLGAATTNPGDVQAVARVGTPGAPREWTVGITKNF
ncbi:MAG: TonB-dependent receptor domain-containing protein [Steroidobacteraceae bacterium]